MQKNVVSFILFSLIVLLGWMWLQRQFPAPKTPEKVAKTDDDKKDPEKKDDGKDKIDPKVEPKIEDKKDEKKDDKKAIPAPEQVATYRLGDDASFLSVTLTNRGAGVEKLEMTQFQAANYLGQPVKPPHVLDYLQEDPIIPSFRMHHYPHPEPVKLEDRKPERGMADILWNVVGEGVVKDDKGWKISFWTLVPDRPTVKITKTYRLQTDAYHVGMAIEIENSATGEKAPFRYQLTGSHGNPHEGEWYQTTSTHTAVMGLVDDNGGLERKVEDAATISKMPLGKGTRVPSGNARMQYAGVMTQYFASLIVVDPKQGGQDWTKAPPIIESALPTRESVETKAQLITILGDKIVFKDDKGEIVTASLLPRARKHLETLGLTEGMTCVVNLAHDARTNEAVATWFRLGQTPLPIFDDITTRIISIPVNVAPSEKVTHQYMLYHGPVKTRLLSQMSGSAAVPPDLVEMYTYTLNLRTLTDYHSNTSMGWFFSQIGWTALLIFCTNLMHSLLYWLHFLCFGNWGISIILMTIVVRGALYPISHRQAVMSQKMQILAPEIKKLQEKYKDDKAKQAQATMELYRKHKVHPASGCLPLLLQLPIMMGLYFCLQESVQFRLATFLWIENLAAPDMLVWWSQNIPMISNPNSMGGMLYLGPFFNVLPVIAVTLMIVQQKLMTPPPQNEEQEVQQRVMQIMMGVMGIFFYKMAAGLCIYFISSTLWGVLERKLLPKKKLDVTAPTEPSSNGSKFTTRERRRERDRKETKEPDTAMSRLKAWWKKLLESAEKK